MSVCKKKRKDLFRFGDMVIPNYENTYIIVLKDDPTRATAHFLCYDVHHMYPKPYLDWWGRLNKHSQCIGIAPLSMMLYTFHCIQKDGGFSNGQINIR